MIKNIHRYCDKCGVKDEYFNINATRYFSGAWDSSGSWLCSYCWKEKMRRQEEREKLSYATPSKWVVDNNKNFVTLQDPSNEYYDITIPIEIWNKIKEII